MPSMITAACMPAAIRSSFTRTAGIFALMAAPLFMPPPASTQVAVIADTVYTMEGEPLVNGVVLIRDGKIEQVGQSAEIVIPDGYELFEGAVVTPGLIDSRSVVGLAGYYNQEHDQDQLEFSSALQPDLRAIDAYNAREELVGFLLQNGITTVHTGHAPGAMVSGQTMVARTAGRTVDEALLDSTTALAITLGPGVRNQFDTPGTRSKGIAMLRQELIRAAEYAEKRRHEDAGQRPGRDLRLEALADMLEGRIFALVTAHQTHDIMSALRLQREFGFPMLLEGASEAWMLMDEIRESGVTVILHPSMVRLRGETENASFTTARKLGEAGIPFVFQSGYESYVPKTRVVLYEAAVAVGFGLDRMDALRALTTTPAALFGLDHRLGSLKPGKDADLVIFNGDPFEYTTRPTHVFVNGMLKYAYY
jgi:imidazolonepropionase-like amidohydrolase